MLLLVLARSLSGKYLSYSFQLTVSRKLGVCIVRYAYFNHFLMLTEKMDNEIMHYETQLKKLNEKKTKGERTKMNQNEPKCLLLHRICVLSFCQITNKWMNEFYLMSPTKRIHFSKWAQCKRMCLLFCFFFMMESQMNVGFVFIREYEMHNYHFSIEIKNTNNLSLTQT